jgi:hypothetical protein
MDNDDEVRDRATYFRAILDKQEAALNSMYILNGMQVPPSRLPFLPPCPSGVICIGLGSDARNISGYERTAAISRKRFSMVLSQYGTLCM